MPEVSSLRPPPPIAIPVQPGVNGPALSPNRCCRCWETVASKCHAIGRGFWQAPWKNASPKELFLQFSAIEAGFGLAMGAACLATKVVSPWMLSVGLLFPTVKSHFTSLKAWEQVGKSAAIFLTSGAIVAGGFSLVYFSYPK